MGASVNLSGKENVPWFSRDLFLRAALVFFTIWGFGTKFLISLNLPLNSDDAGMGLLSMEIGKHNNIFLTGYHLFSSNTYVTTELPLQVVPQILTGYSPVALKIVIFCVFVTSVLALAYLVFSITKNRITAFLFCALAASLPPGGYLSFAHPTAHNATVLAGAAILIILFSLFRASGEQKPVPNKRGAKKTAEIRIVPYGPLLMLIVLVFLSVFADTIIFFWVLIPFTAAYLVLFRTAYPRMNLAIGTAAAAAAAAYIAKTYFMPDWITLTYVLQSAHDVVFVNIPLLFRILPQFINTGLSALAGHGIFWPADLLSLVLFAGLMFLCVKNVRVLRNRADPGMKLLYGFCLVSVLVMAAMFLVSGNVSDLGGARYLTFTALVILILIALSCPVTETVCPVLVLLLLLVSAVTAGIYVSAMDSRPNAREYDLIRELNVQNLTHGYSIYWDANIITYLSGEDATIRSVYVTEDDLKPFYVNACNRWYSGRPDRPFFLYDRTQPDDESQTNYGLLKKTLGAADTLQYRDYEILLFHPS